MRQVHFALSSDAEFSERASGGGGFSRCEFYLSLIGTVREWPKANRENLLAWWSRYVAMH